MKAIILITSLVLIGIALLICDGVYSETEYFEGKVVDKFYKAKRSSVGSGTAVTSNGKVGIVTTTEVDPEKFLIMVELSNGEIITTTGTSKLYYKKEKEDRIKCYYSKGYFTGWTWGVYSYE